MQLTHNEIGRIVSAMHPDMVRSIHEDYQKLSDDLSIVPEIRIIMDALFPDMEDWERKVFFVALVYRIFSPASFLPPFIIDGKPDRQAVSKLPIGVRPLIARCMGFNNAEMSSHYKGFAEAHIKNPRYRAKMRQVTDAMGLTKPKTLQQ